MIRSVLSNWFDRAINGKQEVLSNWFDRAINGKQEVNFQK